MVEGTERRQRRLGVNGDRRVGGMLRWEAMWGVRIPPRRRGEWEQRTGRREGGRMAEREGGKEGR